MMNVDELLQEREKTHGKYSDVAKRFEMISDAVFCGYVYDEKFTADQYLALIMIIGKLARIVEGDADFVDHWKDLAGYPELVVRELEKGRTQFFIDDPHEPAEYSEKEKEAHIKAWYEKQTVDAVDRVERHQKLMQVPPLPRWHNHPDAPGSGDEWIEIDRDTFILCAKLSGFPIRENNLFELGKWTLPRCTLERYLPNSPFLREPSAGDQEDDQPAGVEIAGHQL